MISQIPSSLYFFVYLTLVLLTQIPNKVLSHLDIIERATPVKRLDRLQLPPNAVGPLYTTFDRTGAGPYIGVSNGRILKWSGSSTGFIDFAVTSKNWSRQVCETNDTNLEPVCGRPICIGFDNKKGTLYISDAYKNLRAVESKGGAATRLASSAEGVSFTLTSGAVVDQQTGFVYFTDASTRFQIKDLEKALLSGDMTGRLMKYDSTTKQVTVLLRNLGMAASTSISKDGRFVLVSEYTQSRITRYWLKGSKANTSDIFFALATGSPSGIIRNKNGDFWVAYSIGTLQNATPLGILLDKHGHILRVLNFATTNVSLIITSVQEYAGKLYVGSLDLDYVGVTNTTRG